MLSPDHRLRAYKVPAPEKISFPAINGSATTPGAPFHLEIIPAPPLDPHRLKTFEPHPSLATGFKKRFLGREKFRKTF